jgi:hypothetical protein
MLDRRANHLRCHQISQLSSHRPSQRISQLRNPLFNLASNQLLNHLDSQRLSQHPSRLVNQARNQHHNRLPNRF